LRRSRESAQLIQDTLPANLSVALLADTSDRSHLSLVREAQSAAKSLGIRLHPLVETQGAGQLDEVFRTITKAHAGALLLVGGTAVYANRAQVAEHALKARLPMMCATSEHVKAGCLMSYGPSLTDLYRRAATYVDKILKGAKPADLPVERPTKFELVINLQDR
jgi:putative tryptophan/tyrosine transport system substrate-binding protein